MSRRLGRALLTLTPPAGPAPARAAFTYIALDDPIAAAGTAFAFGINGADAATGDDNDSGGGLRGFVDRGGSYTTLDVPSAIASGPTFANHGGGCILNAGTMTIRDSTILGNDTPVGADVYDAGQLFVYDGIIGVLYP